MSLPCAKKWIVMNSRCECGEEERATCFYRLLDHVKTRKGEFCLLLGNGASIGSGGKRWDEIADEIALKWNLGFPPETLINEKFNLIFRNCGDYQKRAILKSYLLTLQLSDGYMSLANLIKEGYFDVIFTTNFDYLINRSLHEVDLIQDIDFTVLVLTKRSFGDNTGMIELSTKGVLSKLKDKEINIKVVKLHGDLTYPDTLIITDDDIKANTVIVKEVLGGYLKDNPQKGILLVGYSGRDTDIAAALNEAEGNESVWWLNPNMPSLKDPIASFVTARNVFPYNAISGDRGKFDHVFSELHNKLIKSKITTSSELNTILKKIQNVGEGKGQENDIDAIITFLESHSLVLPSTITLMRNLTGEEQLQLFDILSRFRYIGNASYRLAIGQYSIGIFLYLLLDNNIINNIEKLRRLIERGSALFSENLIEQNAEKIIQTVFEADCTGYNLQALKISVQDQLSSLESEKIQNNSYHQIVEKFDKIISSFGRLVEFERFADKTRPTLDLINFEKIFLEMANDLTEIVYPVSKISHYPPHMKELIEKCNELERKLRVVPYITTNDKISQYNWLAKLNRNSDVDSSRRRNNEKQKK